MNEPFTLTLPVAQAELPLLLDSPHSGNEFPAGFRSIASREALLTAWDAHVEELWSGAVEHGASLLQANFPRVVIDPNRAGNDIDPELLAQPWPAAWDPIAPSAYSRRGMGLIRRYILPGQPMYQHPLAPDEIRKRIETLYAPYHLDLHTRLQALRDRYGRAWHINCHSMKSAGNAMNVDAGRSRPDFVVSDAEGKSSDSGFGDQIVEVLSGMGYSVQRNDPYKGGYIVRHYGNPVNGINSIQIEINRRCYFDEARFVKSAEFSSLRQNLTVLSSRLAAMIRRELGGECQ